MSNEKESISHLQDISNIYFRCLTISTPTRHGGFVLEPSVLLLRPLNRLLESADQFYAFQFPTNDSEPLPRESDENETEKNQHKDIGSLKVESALLASTTSSSLLFNLLRLEGNSTEATYAKDLAEEIEKGKGTFVVRNEEKTSKRTAIDVTREAGMKANEFVKGESYLARIIQTIWGINNSTTVV